MLEDPHQSGVFFYRQMSWLSQRGETVQPYARRSKAYTTIINESKRPTMIDEILYKSDAVLPPRQLNAACRPVCVIKAHTSKIPSDAWKPIKGKPGKSSLVYNLEDETLPTGQHYNGFSWTRRGG